MNDNNFIVILQAMLDEIKSIANIKENIKSIEQKLPKLKIWGTLDSAGTQTDLNAKIKAMKAPKVKVDADTAGFDKQIDAANRKLSSGIGATGVKVPFKFDLSDANDVEREINRIVAEITNNQGQLVKYRINLDENGKATRAMLTYRNALNEVTNAELKLKNTGKWQDANGVEHQIVQWSEGYKVLSQNIEATAKANQRQIESDNQVLRKKEELAAQMKLLNTQAGKAGLSLNSDNQNAFKNLSAKASTLEDIKQLENYLRLARTEYQTFNAEIAKGTHASSIETMKSTLQRMPNDIALLEARFNSIKMPESVGIQIGQLKTDLQAINGIADPNEKIAKYNAMVSSLQNLQKQYQILSQEQKNLNAGQQALQGANVLTNRIITWMYGNRDAAAQYDAELRKILTDLQNCGNKADLAKLQQQFRQIQTQTQAMASGLRGAKKETKGLWDTLLGGTIVLKLVRMGVYKVVQTIREAINGIRELDTIKTNLQMVTQTSDTGANSMMRKYNQMAMELGSTTKSVSEAANEFLRMGESIENTDELIRSSQILSKVGLIESSEAANYLVSSLKGYQIEAGKSISIIDKLTAVDLQAAVSSGELALAMSRCANIARNSGIEMDRLIGYLATVGEVTQKSASEVGNSFQAMFSRMNNIKIGKFIDDETNESLSDTEAVLNKIGIKLRDTENTYRDFDSVLDDVGKSWKDFTKVEQNAIAVAIAGTRQRENFEALMNNYADALKYAETAANSAGSAMERYGIYQDSIQAKTDKLKAAIESLSMNTVSEETFSGIISATENIVRFIDKTNLLKGTLAGFIAMGISKAFVAVSASLISAARSTAQLTAAMAMFDKGRSAENLNQIGMACNRLSNNQLRLVLSTRGLTYEQQKQILLGKGLAEAEAEAALATLGFANAENVATVSTFSFKGALDALKTAIATNPIGLIVTVVTTAAMAFSWLKQKQEENAQAVKDSISEYESAKSSLENINSELEEQNKKIDELLAKDKLTYAEKGQLEELQEITKELLLQQDIEERRAAAASKEAAKKTLDAYRKQYGKFDMSKEDVEEKLGYEVFTGPQNENDITGNIAGYVEALQLLDDVQKELEAAMEKGGDTKWIDDNQQRYIDMTNELKDTLDKNISDLHEKRVALEDEYNKAIDKRQNGIEPLTTTDTDIIETYETIYNTIKMIYEYTDQNAWNNMEIANVFNTEGVEKTKDELIEMAKAGELTPETIVSYRNLNKAIQDSELFLNNGQTAAEAFCDEIYACVKASDELADKNSDPTPLSISEIMDKLNTQLKPTFDSLKSAYQDIFVLDDNGNEVFKPENVDLSMFKDIRSKMEELGKIGINVDSSALDNLAKTLTTAGVGSGDVKKAFNDFATEIYNATTATEGITDETVRFVTQMLESLGITNADEVALNALTEAKASAIVASYDFANASEEDMAAMLNEAQAAGVAEEAIASLAFSKILENNAHVETLDDINRILSLAKAAGIGAEALARLAQFRDDLEKETDPKTRQWIKKSINEYIKTLNKEIQNVGTEVEVQVDFPHDAPKSKKEKDTAKEFDWIEQSIENIEKEVKKLDDVVNSAYSTFSQKNTAPAQEMGKVTEEIGLQQQAYEAYMRKADSIGLSEEYKALVRDGAINIENISDESLQKKISEYQQWYEKAVSVSDAVSGLGEKLKDLHVKGYELNADRYGELLNSQSITEKQYLEEMGRLYREYYENQTEYAEKAHEAKLRLLEKEKSYLNSVANAAASLFDKEIDKINDNAKAQEKIYKDQIKAHEKQIKAYEDEIGHLNDRKKPLQDELDALEDKAREENLILDLQEKQYGLKRAENQKDKLIYKDNQMVYDKDLQGIRDRKKEVEDAKLEIRKNDIQKRIDALDDEIEKYNELIDAVNDHIDGLNGMVDQINDAADAQVEALERLRNKWQEVIDQQEAAKNLLLLTGEFGADAVNKILSGDGGLLSQWKQSYISTLGEIDMESQGCIGNMTRQLASLYNVDLSPLQAQFGNVTESVNGVTEALAGASGTISGVPAPDGKGTNTGGESKSPDINSLENAILQETETAMGAFAQHTEKLTGEVVPAIQSAAQEMDVFNEAAGRDIDKVVTITYQTVGSSGRAHAEGTVGKAFANGYNGLKHDEKNALRSEYGQPELTVYPDGMTELTTQPTMGDLPKDTVIFNGEQTRKILNGGTLSSVIKGKAFADGTASRYVPLSPDDPALELRRKFDAYAERVGGKIEDILMPVNAIQRHFEDLEKIVNNSMVYNTVNNNQPSVTVNGGINITCPGVTSNDVAKQVGKEVEKIFFGLGMKAYQRSMISR